VRAPSSLQARLALWLGALLTLLWLAAAAATALIIRHDLDAVFDSALQEAAQRLLPLAVVEIVGREEEGVAQRLGVVREHDELFTYIVRDGAGRILLRSHAAIPDTFPAYDGPGFRATATHRLYSEEALQGTIRITVAEPLAHRTAVAREVRMGLGLPLLVVIPAALLAILLAVRRSLAPLRRFRDRLAERGARDLTPVPSTDLPSELAPVAATVNALLERLKAAFEAERSFAANAAHELRTPLAGAIAQAQRLQAETRDETAAERAAEIEAVLKRLTRRTERLLQLARAEGARLRLDRPADLRPALRLVVDDIRRGGAGGRVALHLPDAPVLSELDPDAVGIVCRNLVDNALRHGDPAAPVEVTLTPDSRLIVANDGPVVPAEVLARLADRFERGSPDQEGSGLGLAIVTAIAERLGSRLEFRSPRPGHASGLEVSMNLSASETDGPVAWRREARCHRSQGG
jgi:two-component system, OmpR family, sensor kinase